jgi:hypothetical protein
LRNSLFSKFLPILLCAGFARATDSVGVSGTVLHQAGRNWLQLQVDSVGACREIAVDSIKVAGFDPLLLSYGDPERDVDVWWRIVEASPRRHCESTRMARNLVELPAARGSSQSKDSSLVRWLPYHVTAHGNGREVRFVPKVVDHAGMSHGEDCVMYDIVCVMHVDLESFPPSPTRWLDSLLCRTREGRAVILTRGRSQGVPARRIVDVPSIGDVYGLGVVSPWSAGHQMWREVLPVSVEQSWGASVPKTLYTGTGRRFYRWNNARPSCCERCDTICAPYPGGDTLASGGPDLEISNDSIWQCSSYYGAEIDHTLASDLNSGDWLLLPDSGEVARGSLGMTLSKGRCGIYRNNAFRIVNDSIVLTGGKLALSALEQTLGIAHKSAGGGVRVVNESRGLRILADVAADENLQVRVRSVSGQILSKATITAPKQSVPLVGHGVFLVEWESRHTSGKVQVVR